MEFSFLLSSVNSNDVFMDLKEFINDFFPQHANESISQWLWRCHFVFGYCNWTLKDMDASGGIFLFLIHH